MRTRARPDQETGVILVNVLSVLALSSAVMVAILTLQDISIERSMRYMDAATAVSYALGGETSAIVALRRDMRDAPDADHYAEAWTAAEEAGALIEGGSFKLVIADEQALFNLNNLAVDGLAAEETLRVLLASLKAPPETARAIAALVVAQAGIDALDDLRAAGVDPLLIPRLSEIACVLPEPTDININTAGEALLSAVLGNRVSARLLVSRRERQGYLSASDIALARIILPPRTGFRSDYFVATTTVTHGTARQVLESRIHRSISDGQPSIAVWSRKRNAAVGLPGPPRLD
ncbi:MAG: type II secretion system protein GspK [Alphaproteobacteria bacterium]|nr:type II secretion system protein GspK [Alphaproteobacteria bacterium]